MKTAGVGGGRARALTAEEAGTGWPALLSVPATRLYCPSTDDRTDLGQRPACDSSSRPYCPGLRSNKGKQTHAGVDFLCFQAVISFCVTLRVCDCHTHESVFGLEGEEEKQACEVLSSSGVGWREQNRADVRWKALRGSWWCHQLSIRGKSGPKER